jgi:hypothetical protein
MKGFLLLSILVILVHGHHTWEHTGVPHLRNVTTGERSRVRFDGEVIDRERKRVVYGEDGREDARINYPEMAKGVAGIFYKWDVSFEEGKWKPKVGTYTKASRTCNLCTTEKFYGESVGPWCTAFLVAPDVIVSAGHCAENPARMRFVFDFDQDEPVVRDCTSVRRVVNSASEDYALFELDRPITDRYIFNTSSSVQPGLRLLLIGHPMGLPLKADAGGSVKGLSTTLIAADLDAYAGNSGSPVISQETGEVVGILVQGNTDFKTQGGCCVSNRCSSSSGCGGTFELSTRISRVTPYL